MKKYFLTMISALLCIMAGSAQNDGFSPDLRYARRIIEDYNRITTPEGIEDYYTVELGGIRQAVYVRGQNRENSMIIFVHGGPGAPMSSDMWLWQKPFEEFFTIVNYDQRAAGRSYALNDPTLYEGNLDIEHYVDDAIELAKHLCEKYAKNKVILMGYSWGSIVSVKAVQKKPELFECYIGIGQVINIMEAERLSYEGVMKRAIIDSNTQTITHLEALKPYPGDTIDPSKINTERQWVYHYGGFIAHNSNPMFFGVGSLSPQYTLDDVQTTSYANDYTAFAVLGKMAEVNITNIKSLPIPVYLLLGRHDLMTPPSLAEKWLEALDAPIKRAVWFENSAHVIPLEEPGKMLITLLDLTGS